MEIEENQSQELYQQLSSCSYSLINKNEVSSETLSDKTLSYPKIPKVEETDKIKGDPSFQRIGEQCFKELSLDQNSEELSKKDTVLDSLTEGIASVGRTGNKLQVTKNKRIEKRVAKGKQKKLTINNNYIVILKQVREDRNSKLLPGMSITPDGIIRLTAYTGQVSFGYLLQRIGQIQEFKKEGLIQLTLQNDDCDDMPINDALNLIGRQPYSAVENLLNMLKQHYFNTNCLRQAMARMKFPEEKQYIKEFNEYVDYCHKYLGAQYEQNSQMFWFGIGRINLDVKDFQFINTGYSSSYLNFLGLDYNTFSSMILRNHKIDLIKDLSQIIDITYIGLDTKTNFKTYDTEYFSSNIITFDGFKIKLHQKRRRIHFNEIMYVNNQKDSQMLDHSQNKQCTMDQQDFKLKNFKENKNEQNDKKSFIFCVTEIDVDMYDLEQLIFYRQRIQQQKLSYDEFINKELSYLFEDVEYSVKSQNFLERYYSDQLQRLQQYQQQRLSSCYNQ